MPAAHFTDPRLASFYDATNGWGSSDDHYLRLIMEAESVVDVGCGTGMILARARQAGHAGRLCGVDPAAAMLEIARNRVSAVEWLASDAARMSFDSEFTLAAMTGHAFQVLVSDEAVLAALRAVRAALVPGGRFAFETRNPAARAWERWDGSTTLAVRADGATARIELTVCDVIDDVICIDEAFTSSEWPGTIVSRSWLRFIESGHLDMLLGRAGFEVEARTGDWDGSPWHEGSPEIIFVARRV